MKATFEEISRKLQVSYRTGKNGNKRKIWGVYVERESSLFSGWYKIEQTEAGKILEENGWTIKDFVEESKKAEHARAILKAKNDAKSGRNYVGIAIKNPAKIEDAAKYYGLTVEEMQAILKQVSKTVENEDHTASNNCSVTDEMLGITLKPSDFVKSVDDTPAIELNLFPEEEETPKESIIKFETGKYYAGESSACNAYIVYKCVSRSKDKVKLQESWLINEVGEKVEMRGDIGTFKVTVHRGEYEEVRLEKRRYVWACSLYKVAEETTPKTEEKVSKVKYWSYELTRIIPPDYENVSFLGAEYVEKLRAKYDGIEKEIIGCKEALGDSGKYRLESVVYSYGHDNELKETVSRCRVMVEYTDEKARGWTATATQLYISAYIIKTDAETGEIVDEWGADKKSMLDSLFKALPEVKKNAEDETCAKNNTDKTENTFTNVLICPVSRLKHSSREKLLGKIKRALETILERIRAGSP